MQLPTQRTAPRLMKIFLVEDSPHICECLKELIEERGEHVVLGCAQTFEEAVECITAQKPDVALFDIRLKQGSGIDALAEAKRLMPGLIGIVMSSHLTPQHEHASRAAGALHVLDKSADLDRIPAILAELSAR
jgi:two-component system, NarL family, response regulator DevR